MTGIESDKTTPIEEVPYPDYSITSVKVENRAKGMFGIRKLEDVSNSDFFDNVEEVIEGRGVYSDVSYLTTTYFGKERRGIRPSITYYQVDGEALWRMGVPERVLTSSVRLETTDQFGNMVALESTNYKLDREAERKKDPNYKPKNNNGDIEWIYGHHLVVEGDGVVAPIEGRLSDDDNIYINDPYSKGDMKAIAETFMFRPSFGNPHMEWE